MPVRYHGSTTAEIAASVEASVRSGSLAPGDALPPVRRLAADLGVSPATVAAAYRTLKERAVIETAGRAGTRVRSRPAIGARSVRRLPVPPGARDVSEGGPDPRLLPALGPVLRRIDATDTPRGYDAAEPLPDLVAEARRRLPAGAPRSGELTLTSGALDGIERALTAHLAPGDAVAVEDPCWANLLDLVAALGLRPVPVPVDDDGPTGPGLARALDSGVGAVVVTGRAQNPTGAVVTAARAELLRRTLADHPNVLVIEDDHAAELADVAPHPVVGSSRHWAFVRSVSKPYGPDLRLSVLAGDDATVARVSGRQRLGAGWVSTVLQRLVLELWRDEATSAVVARARASYTERREALRAALTARGVRCQARAGLNVWVPVDDETGVLARLRDAGWVAAPGSAYRLHSPPGIRITISQLDLADIEPLADAVAEAIAAPTPRIGR